MNHLTEKKLKKWQDAKFGTFIHWGLYTVGGLDCWKMHDMGIPIAEYKDRFEKNFHPDKFNADKLVCAAKDAGCRYMVMGTRHHEGYCLWNTKSTKFSSARIKRDFIGEYVAAARKGGMLVGIYYSLLDWRFKSYFQGPKKDPVGWKKLVDMVHRQVQELMANYGKIDILWYDGGWAAHTWGFEPTEQEIAGFWESDKLNRMVRELQPEILINNRSFPYSAGDFGTPEQKITPEHRPWELCDTMGNLWGAAKQDLNRKSAREIITRLITCVSLGGNMLLNIGPNANGSIQGWQKKLLDEIGKWVKKHSEAIYGCGGEWQSPFNCGLAPWRTTRKNDNLYLHLVHYPGSSFSVNAWHNEHIVSASLMDTGTQLKIYHEATRDIISGLPEKSPDPIIPVVKLRVRPKTPEEKERLEFVGVDNPE